MSYVVIVTDDFSHGRVKAYECDSYKQATVKLNTMFQKRLKDELNNGSSISEQRTVSKEGYARITWMDGSLVKYRVAELFKD